MRYQLAFPLGFLLLVGGCAALEEELARRSPSATIESARLGEVSFAGAELIAAVRIDNPNPVGIALDGFDYDLQLAGRSLVAGEQDQDVRIGANDAARIEVPVAFTFANVREIAGDLGNRDEIDYALALGLDVDLPALGQRTLPVETRGSLPVPGLPRLSLEQLRIDELGWNGARATLEITVNNPNRFALELDKLDYSLAIAGDRWVSGDTSLNAGVPAGGTGRVEIPVEFDFATIGRGAYQVLTGGGDLVYSLDGRLGGVAGDQRLGAFDLEFSRDGEADLQR